MNSAKRAEAPLHNASLSTVWSIGRHASLTEFVREAHALGFPAVELNYEVTTNSLPEVRRLQATGELVVSSVHDPCPAPGLDYLRHTPQISALDEAERRAGVEQALNTLAFAADLGARAVVIHPGRVDVDRALERRVHELWPQRRSAPAAYTEALGALRTARAAAAPANLEATRHSLHSLAERARDLGLRIGLENRFHYFQIPLAAELGWLLDNLDPGVIGYWHDTGHAVVLENLGLARQWDWLERYGSRLVGIHLH
ncbi:MAG: sugar phosphate isomerase/epimerase family protein, partial [Chloroflexota bacterium]